MRKSILASILLVVWSNAFGGTVELPVERLALPDVQGVHLVCVWDDTAGVWLGAHKAYDHSGVYEFKLPAWGKWYWVGLWDQAAGEYVYGKWVGHFPTD